MGLIFYGKSPRCVDERDEEGINALPLTVPRAGVFVDASREYVRERVMRYNLRFVQLHGQEPPALCDFLTGCANVIKSFRVQTVEDFKMCLPYEGCCDFFLFDTPTPQYGGSGKKFDWEILQAYKGKTPFFLSGGIAPEDADIIRRLNYPRLAAVDLNSRFETSPGIKDIDKVRQFLSDINKK
jgi:phosphoribosylanthranilate isomerase